jgi:cellobiose phosphorylase
MINPINHGTSPDIVNTYKAEPYVVAADVYGVPPHIGRGGWTWYTGSAGWMYQLIIESILGLKREGNILRFEPCIPFEWKSFWINYRFGRTQYQIQFRNINGEFSSLTLDNIDQPENAVVLQDDGQQHQIIVSQSIGAPVLHDK